MEKIALDFFLYVLYWCCFFRIHHSSSVHVVLVSLLVDQLSSLFLPIFGRPKKICSVSGNFWSGSDFFWSTKFLFGIPKFLFSIPKNQSLTKKNSETDQKFPETEQIFFGRSKKVRNRPDNWSTKRLTKTTWTGLDWTIGRPRDWPKPHGRD